MNAITGIYKITSPTGKVYIGQSWNIFQRLWAYKKSRVEYQNHIANSIKKHGWNSHTFEVIYQLPKDIDQQTLDNYEKLFIELYKVAGFEMMNIKEGGSNGKHHPATILKLKELKKGQYTGTRNPFYGKKHSPETLAIISAAKTGSEPWNRGIPHKQESILNMCEARKGGSSWNKGISLFGEQNKFFGRKHSTESLKKMSEVKTGSNNPMYGKLSGNKLVIDSSTGKVFDSISLAANSIGMKANTLRKRLQGKLTNNTNFVYAGS